jgi:hypothetical protein
LVSQKNGDYNRYGVRYAILSKSNFTGKHTMVTFSVADPDPGSVAFLTPGSGIRDGKNPDPGRTTRIIFPRAQKPFFGLKIL